MRVLRIAALIGLATMIAGCASGGKSGARNNVSTTASTTAHEALAKAATAFESYIPPVDAASQNTTNTDADAIAVQKFSDELNAYPCHRARFQRSRSWRRRFPL
jgi:hypothetical protein